MSNPHDISKLLSEVKIMCGRFATAFLLPEKLKVHFHLEMISPFTASYNIAPTLLIPSIHEIDHQRRLSQMTWGLIPHWAKKRDTGLHTFNARVETLSLRPAFRESFRMKRCIVPAFGFYEWQKHGEKKQPFFIHRRDGEPLAVAGLWDSWTDPETQEVVKSCVIITVPANAQMQTIHDRMPAILEAEHFSLWLDPDFQDAALLTEILNRQTNVLTMYPVSSYVNNARHDDETCLKPLVP